MFLDFDECVLSLPDPEEKEMFNQMCRDDDLVPMYVSAEFKLIRSQHTHDDGDLEYEPMPDETLIGGGCDF